nr:hypothetical protein [Paracoccus saliphilus]
MAQTLSMKELVENARRRVAAISPPEAAGAAEQGDLVLDVRKPAERDTEGRVPGALHVPRGILEARADPTTEAAEPQLTALARHRPGACAVRLRRARRWPPTRCAPWDTTPT